MRSVYHLILLVLFAGIRSTSGQEADLSEPGFLSSPWDSFKSYLPNVYRFKRDENGDYAEFVNDLSAVGRILNGLELDRKLRKGSLDMLQVVAEMARVGLDRQLIDELERAEWTELEGKIGKVTDQMNTLSTGGTWDEEKITDGLKALEALVGKVKPIADKLDLEKIKKILDAVAGIESLDYTLIGESHLENLKTLLTKLKNQKDPVPAGDAVTVLTNVQKAKEAAEKIEQMMKMIVAAKAKLAPLNTRFVDDLTSLAELFKVIDIIKQSATDSHQFKDLATELDRFSGASDKSVHLQKALKDMGPSLPVLERFVNAFVSGHMMDIKLTAGLPRGVADLDALPADLGLSRNQKLMSGGGRMTVFEDDLKLITAKKGEITKVVTDWKAYHSDKNSQMRLLQVLKRLSATTTGSSSAPNFTPLVSFCNNLEKLFTLANGSTFNPAGDFKDLALSVKDTNRFLLIFNGNSEEIQYLSDLSALKNVLKTNLAPQDSLTTFKNFTLTDLQNNLNTLADIYNQASIQQKIFTDLRDRSGALSKNVPHVVTLRDWVVGVKDFEKPKDLDKSLSATRDIVTNIRKVDPKSLTSIGTVITEVKAVTESAASLKTLKPKADNSGSSIDTWQQLDSYANTIGHAVRSAQALSVTDGIGAKLEKLKQAAKELDEAVQKAKDPTAKAEVQKVWSGYGSIESEVTKMKAEAKKVHDSVPKKTESLKDMAPVLEKMYLINLQFSQLQQTATSFDTFSTTDPDLKQKTSAVQESLKESLVPILSFQSSKKELKLAPDVLQSVYSFFKNFFGVTQPTPSVSGSTTPEAASDGLLWWPFVLIGFAVVGLIAAVAALLFRRSKKPPPKTPTRSSLQKPPLPPSKKDVVIDMNSPLNPTTPPTPKPTNAANSAEPGPTNAANSAEPGPTQNVDKAKGSKEPENQGSVEQAGGEHPSRSTTQDKNKHVSKKRRSRHSKSPAPSPDEVDAVPQKSDATVTEEAETEPTKKKGKKKKAVKVQKLSSEADVSIEKAPVVPVAPVKRAKQPSISKAALLQELTAQERMPRLPSKATFPYMKNISNGKREPDYNMPWPLESLSMNTTNFIRIPYRRDHMVLFMKHFPKTFSRLVEEAKLGTEERGPRDIRLKLFLKGFGLEPFAFYEYRTAKSGAEIIALKPTAEEFAVFLEKAFQWGAVSIAAIVQESLILPNGSERWWPSAIGSIVNQGKTSIKLISESVNDQKDIYTAKLEIWKTEVPDEVSTVHMNILMSEFTLDRLVSVETLARFQTRVQHAQFAAGGVLLRYGDSFEKLAIMMCIHQCIHQVMHSGQDHKIVINDMQNKMPKSIVTKEQYVQICLVVARLFRAILGLPTLPEHLEMERQFDVLRGAVTAPTEAVVASPAAPPAASPAVKVLPVDQTAESEASQKN